jgi:23S rRNA (uracil1939-C5)-methyltransferase
MKIKNKVLTSIQIEGIAAEGKCVARHEGKVLFVSGVAPGDVGDLRIIRKKKSFLEAVPVHFHSCSSLRTEPFCQHFGTCGGCKWQHINYDTQLKYKQQQVVDALQRIAKVPMPEITPILAAPETTYYRNKLEYTFSDNRWLTREEIESGDDLERNTLGFHIPGRFDKILDIEHCYLQPDPSNKIRLSVRDFCIRENIPFFNLQKQTGYVRNLIIRTATTGETMVILQVAGNEPGHLQAILTHITENFPEIASLNYVINTKGNETFHDLPVVTVHGKDHILERMPYQEEGKDPLFFRIGPKSFYQTNSEQAARLYAITLRLAALTGEEVVYDLYSGTGTIANFVAHQAKKVVGVEYVDAAVEDAHWNATHNHIENTSFFAGDMKDLLSESFFRKHGHPDVVITDPPRAGMHEDVINMLLLAAPARIVYVSCNPATQARDVALLSKKYRLTAVQPVDMFPHTHHVENIVCLELHGSDTSHT